MLLVFALLAPALVGGRIFTTGDALMFAPPFAAERPADLQRPSNTLDGDELYTFQPQLLKIRQELGRGELGRWSGDVAAGRPLLASQQQAPLFPLTWLAFLLPFWSSLGWIAAGRLLIAAAGTYRYCRALGHGTTPALLGAISFAFGTYMITWLSHPHANVYALLPWLFLGVRRTCRERSWPAALGLAASIGLTVLGGHPESCAIVLFAAAAYAAFELTGARGLRRRAGLLLAGALGVGICLGAVMILPLAELLGLAGPSSRGGPPAPPHDAYAFVFPELSGRPDKAFSGGDEVNFQERTAYFGVLPLLLAGAGFAVRRGRTELFLAGLGALSLLLVFENPVADLARHAPGVGSVNIVRFLVVAAFAGAVLAAAGLEAGLRGSPAQRRRLLRAMAVLALIPLAGALVWMLAHGQLDLLGRWRGAVQQLPAVHPGQADGSVVQLAALWRWGVLAALAVGALWIAWRRGASRAVAGGLAVAFVALDLLSMAHGYRPMVPRRWALPPTPPSLVWAREHAGSQRVSGADAVLAPDLPSRFGLRTAGAHDLPYPARYENLFEALLPGTSKQLVPGAPRAALFGALFGVRYVVLAPRAPLPGWLKAAHDDPAARIAINPDAAPRAWVTYGWRPSPARTDALLQTLLSSPRQVVAQPVIEGAPVPPAGAPPRDPATLTTDRDEQVTVRARARRPGYLVLGDSMYPGWEARVDGKPAKILPANENFRAVALPAGRHEVVFRYRPASVTAGAVISGLALIGLLGAAVLLALRRRRAGRVRPG